MEFSYYSFVLIFSIIFSMILLIRKAYIFLRLKKKPKVNSSEFMFILFLFFMSIYLIIKLIATLLSPELDISHSSKFSGTDDFIFLSRMLIISNLALNLSAFSLILMLFSFRGVKIYELLMIFLMIAAWAYNLIYFQDMELEYSGLEGWHAVSGKSINYSYNIFMALLIIYSLVSSAVFYSNIKNDLLKKRFSIFFIGVFLIVFLVMFSYFVMNKYFNLPGLEFLGILSGTGVILLSFKAKK